MLQRTCAKSCSILGNILPTATAATATSNNLRSVLSSRSFSTSKQKANADGTQEQKQYTVTLFPGDGIGPEISQSVQNIFSAASVPISWETYQIGPEHVKPGSLDLISQDALDSCLRNKVGLKGPFGTPIGTGHRSLNLTLRKALNLYANVRPCRSIPGVETRYQDVDVHTIRENTEGEYSGLEHEATPGVVENLKVITRAGSLRVAEYAFDYARRHQRKRLTAVHKATIMKLSDGLFLETCREVSRKYPEIKYDELHVGDVCLKLVRNPKSLDCMVMPNLYGDIVSDLCAGLIGGLGLTPSGNIGEKAAVFESVHGTAPDIAGKNKANPSALILSAVMMLRHMQLTQYASNIEQAVFATLADSKTRTADLGGKLSCTDFTQAIIDHLK